MNLHPLEVGPNLSCQPCHLEEILQAAGSAVPTCCNDLHIQRDGGMAASLDVFSKCTSKQLSNVDS